MIPAVIRARLHRESAVLLADDGAPPGVIGGQLLVAERVGDPRTVELLHRAADEALARGEPRVAAELLARALEEPPPSAGRPDVLVALARAEARLASPAAIDRFREALAAIDDRRRRAELLLELGHALVATARWHEATAAFEQGIAELRDSGAVAEGASDEQDRDLHDRLEAGFVSSAWVGIGRFREAEAIVDRILREERLGPVHRGLAVWAAFQRSTIAFSTAEQQAAIVRHAIAEAPIAQLVLEGQLVEVASGVLVTTDELGFQIDLLSRAIDAAERGGAFGKVGVYLYCRTWPHLYTGRLTDAIADAQASLRISELGWETFAPATHAALAMAHVERGEIDAAAEAIEIDEGRWGGRIDTEVLVPLARGRIALARGDAEAALAEFRRAGVIPTQIGMRLLIPTEWRLWMVVALARLGLRDEARAAADEAVAIARQRGAKWSLGCALRVAGLAYGGPDAIDLFREASDLLETSPARLERARLLVDFGAALRRLGRRREAREILATATDLAHRIGALALLEEGRRELVLAGSRPRRYALSGIESLTPAELRVARLVADGRTNREVAQALFITPKAVEFHLTNAYTKLGLSSRHELGAALGAAADGADGSSAT
jgi:DNA-binding CsgD family transcriptional regulator